MTGKLQITICLLRGVHFYFYFDFSLYFNRPGKIPRNRSSVSWFHSNRHCIEGTLVFPTNLTLADVLCWEISQSPLQTIQSTKECLDSDKDRKHSVFKYFVVYVVQKKTHFPRNRQKCSARYTQCCGGWKMGQSSIIHPQENTSVQANTSVSSKIRMIYGADWALFLTISSFSPLFLSLHSAYT